MREKLFATLEEKRRKLKEEKDNCELAYGKGRKKKVMVKSLLIRKYSS